MLLRWPELLEIAFSTDWLGHSVWRRGYYPHPGLFFKIEFQKMNCRLSCSLRWTPRIQATYRGWFFRLVVVVIVWKLEKNIRSRSDRPRYREKGAKLKTVRERANIRWQSLRFVVELLTLTWPWLSVPDELRAVHRHGPYTYEKSRWKGSRFKVYYT